MSLSDRDKKLLIAIVPILVLGAFWFLLLAPKRDEAAQAEQDAIAQEERRDQAQVQLDQASAAQTDFAADYGEIVRLGKAIPAQVDMPSLLVQLEAAAEGTGIRFTKIATGDRTDVAAAAPAPAPATPPADGTTPADAGGAPAQSAPGTAAEAANTAAATSDQRSGAAEQSGVDPADAQTSTSSGQGLPVGGGSAAPADPAATTVSPVGLETVPLELEFVGDFFNLADFFHDVKRFVRVAGTSVVVGGRLITIESVNYSSDQTVFPGIKAELKATVYLSPKVEGETAGATPQGPPTTTPASTPADSTEPAPDGPHPDRSSDSVRTSSHESLPSRSLAGPAREAPVARGYRAAARPRGRARAARQAGRGPRPCAGRQGPGSEQGGRAGLAARPGLPRGGRRRRRRLHARRVRPLEPLPAA